MSFTRWAMIALVYPLSNTGLVHPLTRTDNNAMLDAIAHGNGAYLYDSDGNDYLDFVAGIAVMALGHSDPEWVAAISMSA